MGRLCFRKEQILEIPWKNRIREREEPPSILANPSQFAVCASVREAILNKWITFFSAPIDNIKDFEETEVKENRCNCNFKVIHSFDCSYVTSSFSLHFITR